MCSQRKMEVSNQLVYANSDGNTFCMICQYAGKHFFFVKSLGISTKRVNTALKKKAGSQMCPQPRRRQPA